MNRLYPIWGFALMVGWGLLLYPVALATWWWQRKGEER